MNNSRHNSSKKTILITGASTGIMVKVFETPTPKARYAFVRGRFLNWTLPASLSHLWLDRLLARLMALDNFKQSSLC